MVRVRRGGRVVIEDVTEIERHPRPERLLKNDLRREKVVAEVGGVWVDREVVLQARILPERLFQKVGELQREVALRVAAGVLLAQPRETAFRPEAEGRALRD